MRDRSLLARPGFTLSAAGLTFTAASAFGQEAGSGAATTGSATGSAAGSATGGASGNAATGGGAGDSAPGGTGAATSPSIAAPDTAPPPAPGAGAGSSSSVTVSPSAPTPAPGGTVILDRGGDGGMALDGGSGGWVMAGIILLIVLVILGLIKYLVGGSRTGTRT